MLQHPKAKPMKIDIGTTTWTGVARVRHNVNTEGGSSGAPIFNAALELVGTPSCGIRLAARRPPVQSGDTF